MKKSLLIGIPALLLATSCVNSLTDYNVDPKYPASVSGGSLVSAAELGLTRTMVSTNVNLNVFRLYVQQLTETTYFDESIYDIATRQINRGFWRALYTGGGSTDPTYDPGVLSNLNKAKQVINADNSITAAVKANQLACVEVLSVYAWTVLVDTYGNVPYTQALDVTIPQPKYDDAATIYSDLFTRLDAAIATLNTNATAAGLGQADLVYGGDTGSWIKFANSLKLRMAIVTSDADGARAKTAAEAAAPNVFADNSEEADLDFLSSPPNTNPLWEDLIQSGRHDFVGTSVFVDTLATMSDPRLPFYFFPAPAGPNKGKYVGGVYGESNDYTQFSNPGPYETNPSSPGQLESYAEVEFLLAEAASRGFNVGGSTQTHYEAGIKASINYYGGTDDDVTNYLAQPSVDFGTATGTDKQKIGFQSWIALYNQPVQAWTAWRRTDTPQLTPAADGLLPYIPVRFPYPYDEQNINATNYKAAAAALGSNGDKANTKIFWDKF